MVMPKLFFITGSPRSRTAWLSAFFNTHEDVICLHEPINQFGNIETVNKYIQSLPYKYVGISDSSLYSYVNSIVKEFMYSPVVFVKRDKDEVIKSFNKFLLLSEKECTPKINNILGEINNLLNNSIFPVWSWKIIDYKDLDGLNTIEDIWRYCAPAIPFDKRKVEIFQKLLINQHTEKVIAEMEIDNTVTINTN